MLKKEMESEDLVEYPHFMYNPETGAKVKITNKEEHDKYTKKGWTHNKPEKYKDIGKSKKIDNES